MSGFFSQGRMTSRVRRCAADVVEEDFAVGGDGGIKGRGVDGFDFFLVGVECGDLLLDIRSRVVFELGVVLMEACRGAGGGGEVEVDVREILVGEEVEGLEGAVGGEVLGVCGRDDEECREECEDWEACEGHVVGSVSARRVHDGRRG